MAINCCRTNIIAESKLERICCKIQQKHQILTFAK